MNVEQLLELLVCPKCHGKLRAVKASEHASSALGCASCQLQYALEDGLPNMLISEAHPWEQGSQASAAR